MFGVMNWICLICVSLLVGEIMIYFCKDVIKILDLSKNKKARSVEITKAREQVNIYETKIAK
ncbi:MULTISPECIES: hypothetical protein [Romboutsia]|uniref:Uncharacterized protein n=1 Tax=Romboutsia hominis TaxID=1507512 RepID=A0A2P2BV44_9FIRM|nr:MULTISPECIES: hypothetical protein [Romboutsia]MCH1958967.1 hypothetical protein [Romboutsia hominis]MCH1968092.1 hypothetical protein [Romboutsia hominis]MDB8790479.1 hypothetical protein [Romboutsia sp. 1001216sp1]MDB8793928.1 hypothetical protein [Romboutsia sp. 1001216sp1]MDB8796855.1 hypothetical protein [Romboutsia sp. 1001216sp1]